MLYNFGYYYGKYQQINTVPPQVKISLSTHKSRVCMLDECQFAFQIAENFISMITCCILRRSRVENTLVKANG